MTADDDRVLGLFRRLADEMKTGASDDDVAARVAEAQRDPERRVGAYVLLDAIGEGGAGRVFRAWHAELKRLCAIKFLTVDSDDQRARLQREAQTAAKLAHPCIVAVYEIGAHRGAPFIAMEYVDGPTLGQVRMTPREALELMRAIAEAVQFAHDRGILHRDLKPANILVGRDGRPRITDFGLARPQERGSTITAPGAVVGTPAFMAPECAVGDAADVRSDVYGLGATLYTLLAGAPPYAGASLEVLRRLSCEDPEPLTRRVPSLHRDVDTIVRKAMAREPARRYATARAFADDIARYLEGQAILARPASIAWRLRRALARNLAASLLAAAVLATAGVAVWLGTRDVASRRELEGVERKIGELLGRASAALRRAEEMQYEDGVTISRVGEQADRAIELLRASLALDSRHAKAHAMLAQALALAGRTDESVAAFGAALASDPGQADALLGRGRILLARWRDAKHDDDLRRRALDDLRAGAHDDYARATIAQAEGRHEEALALCERAPSAEMHLLAARALEALGRRPEADERCTRAIETRPGHAPAHAQRGYLRYDLGDYARAKEDLVRAMQYNPLVAGHWNMLGLCEYLGGMSTERAIDALTQSLTLDPMFARAWCNRAIVHQARGDFRRALDDLDMAVRKSPDMIELYKNRSAVHQRLKDYARALEDAETMVARWPRNPLAWSTRAGVRMLMKDPVPAREDIEQALSLDPRDVESLVVKATMLAEDKRYDESISLADQAIAIDPRFGRAYGARGIARFLSGRRAEAKADFREAARLDPSLAGAYRVLLDE